LGSNDWYFIFTNCAVRSGGQAHVWLVDVVFRYELTGDPTM